MKTLEKRISIIDQIFEDFGNLKKEDLMAISNFAASLSKIISDDKKTDEDALYLLKFFKIEDPIPPEIGQAAINLYNDQRFGYLQKRFKIQPDLVDFLLQEKNDKIDIFLVERKRVDGIPCLDIAYKNSTNGEYYCVDNAKGGVIMTDFTDAQKIFEGNCKKKLDLGENPNKYVCPTKIMIDKSHFADFKNFEGGKINPNIHLTTGINLDRTEDDFFKRVTLVMNFSHEKNGIYQPDMAYYFDTYHLCPPGTC